jgi:hypothetical protein
VHDVPSSNGGRCSRSVIYVSGALECISPLYAFKSVTLRINLSLSYFDETLSSNLNFHAVQI